MANLKFGENDIQSTVRDVIFLKLVYLAIYPDELFIPMYYVSSGFCLSLDMVLGVAIYYYMAQS